MPNDPTWDDTSDVSEPIWEDTKEVPQPAIKLSPYEQYRLKGGEPVAGPFGPANPEEVPALLEAAQRPFIPLPDTQAKGPLAAAYRSVIKPVVEGIESPMGVLMAPALAQSVPLRVAAGVGFGGMAAKSGLEKMQSEDPQTQLEGRMELAGAPLLALSGGVRDKVAPTPEIAPPRPISAVPEALPKTPEIVSPDLGKAISAWKDNVTGRVVVGKWGDTHSDVAREVGRGFLTSDRIRNGELEQGFVTPSGEFITVNEFENGSKGWFRSYNGFPRFAPEELKTPPIEDLPSKEPPVAALPKAPEIVPRGTAERAPTPEEREFELLHEHWLPTIKPWRQELLKEEVAKGEGTSLSNIETNFQDSPGARDVVRAKRYYELARKLYARTGETPEPTEVTPKLPKEPPVAAQGEPVISTPQITQEIRDRLNNKSKVVEEIDRILENARERMSKADPAMVGLLPTEFDWLTEPERNELHNLKLKLPSSGEEALAARERIRLKRQSKTPPSAITGEATPTAPAVSEAQVAGGATPSTEPAKVEATPTPPTPQAPNVTPTVTEGPGAASVGDIPKQSQLSQLSGQIQAQQGRISPNTPISDRIANAVNVGERWAKAKDSATQGLAKTRAASQALINAYVNQPKWTDFISSIGRWVGADQKTALEVRDFQKAIVKAVPNRLRQEAITNWIQANGDEALLRQRAEASKPSVRRGYEVALELNDAEKNLARNIQSYLESRLDEGLKAGLLKQGVENYVTQVWKRPTSQTQKMWADLFGVGTLNPNFKYAKQRIFDSYFEGEQAGFIPKNKTIGNLVSIYDLAFNRALSARGLIKELQSGKAEDGMPITMTSGKTSPVSGDANIPEAFLIKPNTPPTGAVTADGRPYRPIDHWALRDWKWATKGPQGQPVFVQGDMLVHPDHWNHLNNVLKHSRLQSNPVTGTILRAAGIAKQTKLSLSPFHTIQEGVHAASHRVNPFAPTELDLNVPEQKALVDHGLMVQDPRAQELFAEGASGGGLVGKIPGLGNLQQWYTEVTFKDYIPKLKMNMALDALERNRKAYAGKLNDDQILALTARESNAAFGEQNYRLMGRSPNVQDFMRLALLAPDFLESRARFIGQALKPYGREQRIALGLMAGVLYTAARVINKATDDDYHWDKPFSVFANGKEYRLRTLLGDAQHLLTDPRSFWYNRLSPISRTLSEYVTGRDDRGIKRSSMEQLADFASWFKPIPLQVRPEESITQAVLASAGVPSKMHTKGQELFEIADKWMANNTDPKIQEHYKRVRQETLPESPYRPLRDALRAGNIKGARDVYQKLLPTHAHKIISETLNPNKPLTGLSKANEVKFVNSLDASQRKVYDAARAEKRTIWQNYQRMLKGE